MKAADLLDYLIYVNIDIRLPCDLSAPGFSHTDSTYRSEEIQIVRSNVHNSKNKAINYNIQLFIIFSRARAVYFGCGENSGWSLALVANGVIYVMEIVWLRKLH